MNNIKKLLHINTIKPDNQNKQTKYNELTTTLRNLNTKYLVNKYIGKGIYGDIYLVKNNDNRFKFNNLICKEIILTDENKKQVLIEIGLLYHLSKTRNSAKFIIPCIDYIFHKDKLYSFFPVFSGYKLSNFKYDLRKMSKSQYIQLVKFIIKQLLIAITSIHSNFIFHNNIDDTSIIINYSNGYDNISIKYVDFTLSCGNYIDKNNNKMTAKCEIPTKYMNNIENIKFKDKFNDYVKEFIPNMKDTETYKLSQVNDIWCLGIICYDLIHCKSKINISKKDGILLTNGWSNNNYKFRKPEYKELEKYNEIICNNMLCPFNERLSGKKIINKILAFEKYK